MELKIIIMEVGVIIHGEVIAATAQSLEVCISNESKIR